MVLCSAPALAPRSPKPPPSASNQPTDAPTHPHPPLLQAGAGLVADSVPESEWEETVNKSAALGRAIDLAEQAFVAADAGGGQA